MNKKFWMIIANAWCKKIDSMNSEDIANKAQEDAKRDVNSQPCYSKNPLDDMEDDDDDY